MKNKYLFLYHISGFILVILSVIVSIFLNPAELPVINLITFLPIFALVLYTVLQFRKITCAPPVWVILVSIGLYIIIGIPLINLAIYLLPAPMHRAILASIFLYLATMVTIVLILLKKRTKYVFLSRIFTLFAFFMFVMSSIGSFIHCFTPFIEVNT